jgi:hypothetical protein
VICTAQPQLWVCHVVFIAAWSIEIERGFLGLVSCHFCGVVRLHPMRVRRLYDGGIRIKVRRGGVDIAGQVVVFDEETRREIHELILAAAEFREALARMGIEVRP